MRPKKTPPYLHFKPRNRGFSWWRRKRVYFPGPFESKESRDAYLAFLNSLDQSSVPVSQIIQETPASDNLELTVAGFGDHFLEHAKQVHPGRQSEFGRYFRIVTFIVERYGEIPVKKFGPLKLAAVRDELANVPQVRKIRDRQKSVIGERQYRLSRSSVNYLLGHAKRWFKWGVTQELIEPNQFAALQTVSGVGHGKSLAKEPQARRPVEWSTVELILGLVSPVVADMIRFQWFTGCRTQNLCNLCPREINTTAKPWVWTPASHKGNWRGHELVIFLGPKAVKIIRKYLNRADDANCFSPREGHTAQLTGHGVKVKSEFRNLSCRYTNDTYLKAITHAIAALATPRIEQPYNREKFRAAGVEYWTPHQLRHAKAQTIREEFGLEAAQAVLGHASLAATQIYAKKRNELAKEIAAKSG